MKLTSFLNLVLLMLLGACGLFNNEVKPKLPPATMEGKNTFGCLIDGKVFVNERTSFFGGAGTHADLQIAGDTTGINIYADSKDKGIIIISFFDQPSLQVNKVYNLADTTFYVQYTKRVDDILCSYEAPISGNIKLTKFDMQKSIISGTFDLKVYSATCNNTVSITEGRFDIGEITR